ncbi:glycoside hydrolase family 31 protein [Anaerosacchariphilus polymeriproducens]|uniref:DUF5110 domain-containing protein n=1 Tax=Anaerosacchariphilus polymeriproducens TaxID=1812858 RepID=A0A371AZP7_9FIRM|nr:glycoside hydrolase family 31 protein [Anaerosacchariphilus polymeriproducens]RDU25026.1 DUF5110 domain-containing protein [Anaerosacchariphilus polymeriproducens]
MKKNQLNTRPNAREENIVQGEKYRFTVLTPQLIRMEYSETGVFENRASQIVINRDFEQCDYRIIDQDDNLVIITSNLRVMYNKQEFSAYGLSVQVLGNISIYNSLWHYGEIGDNLGGTARTLDQVDGSVNLEPGLLSKNGFSILNDSESLLLTEDGWVMPRKNQQKDIYFFGYGRSYKACLKDFYYLCGKTPMLPRFALGNWWSRYYRYSEEDYKRLILRFAEEKIPFSVAVIDMDWHLVDIDEKYGSGWTGFTWNRNLFPNPKEFLQWLHENNLKVTLNIHPAEGIRPYEEMYPDMANALNVDTENEEPVAMDVTNKAFLEAFFNFVNHPNEEDGVDFWWIDWQQGIYSKIKGLDPLWMLNHYYFLDSGRDGKRPMIFSRYAGPGSHRYPLGFSGDTITTWESLEFQPYFTSTASNIGYGWWSHDIGGHMMGMKDDELAVRWLQFGVFSPIMRFHSSNSEFNRKEPWKYSLEIREVMNRFLRLRHEMIPYLYTMNYRNYAYDEPLIQPMYYSYPKVESAYEVKNQYMFGSECIVAPITSRTNRELKMASANVWFPDGKYVDYFTGLVYSGNRHLKCYRDINSIPVFLKEGGIFPVSENMEIENPKELTITVFPGCSNQFELYEDDNTTIGYKTGESVKTLLELIENEFTEFVIHKSQGDLKLIPKIRTYKIRFLATSPTETEVWINQNKVVAETTYNKEDASLNVIIRDVMVINDIRIKFKEKLKLVETNVEKRIFSILDHAQISFLQKEQLFQIVKSEKSCSTKVAELLYLGIDSNLQNSIIEVLTSTEKL